jgi:hypothetical protein
MLSLSDSQLETVMAAAAALEPEKRVVLLERVASHLKLNRRRSGRVADVDVKSALQCALQGLVQSAA